MSDMKIIILKDTNKVGRVGEIKDVADGYALNVLIPQKRAEKATPEKIASLQKLQAQAANAHTAKIAQLVASYRALDTVVIEVKAGESGSLFRSVGLKDICTAIEALNVPAHEDYFTLEKPYKHVGTFELPVTIADWKGIIQVEVRAK
jgi:large subunit ribosomal protein L9